MRSARFRPLFLSLLVSGVLLTAQVSAAEEGSSKEPSKSDLDEIKARLAVLEDQHRDILAKEDEILKELNRVRIWVHKK